MKTEWLYDFTNSDLEIYEKEFKDFLPEKIFDSHVHIFNKECIVDEELAKSKMVIAGEREFTYEDFLKTSQKLLPGKTNTGLFFGLPLNFADIDKCNLYVSDVCKQYKVNGCYIPQEDQQNIPGNFFDQGFIGFKPYPRSKSPENQDDLAKLNIDVRMKDYISEAVLEFADAHQLIIINHLPRAGRLRDRRNIDEITRISEDYPGIKMVLAHCGRAYTYSDIKDNIDFLVKYENIYFDTAMVTEYRVIELLLKKAGAGRMLYATDLPIAAHKGQNVDINNKHYYITKDPQSWSISSDTMSLDDFTFFEFEIIRAIKFSVEKLGYGKSAVEMIFYKNSLSLIDHIKRFNNLE